MNAISDQLIQWFAAKKRSLPWREDITPYRVWISEVMLQQTQVKTVIPYYKNWMRQFSTVRDLACATIDQVFKAWEGLGYYSRARNLHLGSQYLVEKHAGSLPNCENELLKVPGIGPYTCGAILNFAFHKKGYPIDGNIKRVLSRLLALEYDFTKKRDLDLLVEHLDALMPKDKFWIFNEALMELGATVCKATSPSCTTCPISSKCKAKQTGKTSYYPLKAKRKKTISIYRTVFVFHWQNKWLIQKKESSIMKDLHEFYSLETNKNFTFLEKDYPWVKHARLIKALPNVGHSYTQYRATLFSFYVHLNQPVYFENYEWVDSERRQQLAFSSGHRKILNYLLSSLEDSSQNLAYF